MKHNGEEIRLEKDIRLSEYLESQRYDVSKIAVELNGEIIQKVCYEEVWLTTEDVLEVVSFVGGG